ncbi:copper amine oxidase N-terminal domain-containing protein [Paenibacillus sp. L3-i20]|uniref:copper amine oxidase N-terminal domain-containing protein n=1 Tax=Paenibacillus sp. L3-i20 TaxID=2905833 RepID=UPI001EDFFE80|nr:copper amine oxidase N-terminal domain-containing protein [Paenibacillus sp. L3-i20]GKU78152.1 hypothetical protein L3i20_v225490 [Paenibacillus sp. L3-i20]
MYHSQSEKRMSTTYVWLKLFLVAVIAFGGLSITTTSEVNALEALAAVKLTDSKQAIERAKQLKLLPEEKAEIKAIKETKPVEAWKISYSVGKNTEKEFIKESGGITLSAASGELLDFHENVRLNNKGCAYPCELPDPQTIQANIIKAATDFLYSNNWKIDADYKHDNYAISDYVANERGSLFPSVRFNRTHNGVPYLNNGITFRVNPSDNTISEYSFSWSKTTFHLPKDIISPEKAGRILFNAIEPSLVSSMDLRQPEKFKPIYTVSPNSLNNGPVVYKLDAKGNFSEGKAPQTSSPPKNVKAKYSKEYAKHRLLSLYELELQYTDTELGKAEPFYYLRLKQGVPLLHQEPHPYIDAQTGEWINFLHEPLTVKLPPAGDWLIDLVAAPKDIDYKAAVVWDNELVELVNTPIINKGTTLVPFRELLKKLGAKIGYDHAKRKVTASLDGVTVVLTINSKTAYINGKAHTLIAPPLTTKGVTYIPARTVLEAFGAKVGWNSESRLVLVQTNPELPKLTQLQLDQFRLQSQIRWEEKHWK